MKQKRKVNSENEAYPSKGMKQGKDSRSVGSQEQKSPGDMSRGNDGSESPWTPPPSGKPKPGETAGKTKKSNPLDSISSSPSDDSFVSGEGPTQVIGTY